MKDGKPSGCLNCKIITDATALTETLKDAKILDFSLFKLKIENNEFSIELEDGYKSVIPSQTINFKDNKEEKIVSVFGDGLGNALYNLKGALTLWLANGKNLWLQKVTQDLDVDYCVVSKQA